MNRLFDFFVRLFETHPRWAVRVSAAGALGLVFGVVVIVKGAGRGSVAEMIGLLVAAPAFCTAAGVALATADTVRTRLRAGEPVGILARLLFASGMWSLLIWAVVVLIAGFPLAIWLGNLTWSRPAG